MKSEGLAYRFVTLVLRVGLVAALLGAGWFVYRKLPPSAGADPTREASATQLQIVLQPGGRGTRLDIPVKVYPIDLVAAGHEYFTERRPGKRFEDFVQERMNGRKELVTRLDKQGQGTLTVSSGKWWIHALLSGEEDLEWHLPVTVAGEKQTVELTPQNAYTRAKSF